jgi:hypothetical protein
MKHRNPLLVFFLGFITLGIYQIYWFVSTKKEMNARGEKLPTAWILIIPIIGPIWFFWVFSKATENVTNNSINSVVGFLLLYFLSSIGAAIIQDSFNGVMTINGSATAPITPVATTTPVYANPNVIQTIELQQPATQEPAIVVSGTNFSQQPPTQTTPTVPQPPVDPTNKPPTVSG